MQLSKQSKLSQAITVTNGAAGATDVAGAVIDMLGWEGVLFIVQFGAIVANAATSIKAQHGDAANLSDAADLAGTAQTVADNDDEKTFYIDIVKPTKRYLRLFVARATQNATVSAVALQYRPRKAPSTHQATVIVGESHVSPAAGTA